MPNYSYACTECGHAFDIYQAFTDDALTTCPQCQGVLRKKFSAVGVVFKGSGFYRNDARSAGESGGAAKKESDAGSGSKDNGADSGSAAKKSDDATPAGTKSSTPAAGTSGPTTKKPAKAGASA